MTNLDDPLRTREVGSKRSDDGQVLYPSLCSIALSALSPEIWSPKARSIVQVQRRILFSFVFFGGFLFSFSQFVLPVKAKLHSRRFSFKTHNTRYPSIITTNEIQRQTSDFLLPLTRSVLSGRIYDSESETFLLTAQSLARTIDRRRKSFGRASHVIVRIRRSSKGKRARHSPDQLQPQLGRQRCCSLFHPKIRIDKPCKRIFERKNDVHETLTPHRRSKRVSDLVVLGLLSTRICTGKPFHCDHDF